MNTSFPSLSVWERKAIDLELVVCVRTNASFPSFIAPVCTKNINGTETYHVIKSYQESQLKVKPKESQAKEMHLYASTALQSNITKNEEVIIITYKIHIPKSLQLTMKLVTNKHMVYKSTACILCAGSCFRLAFTRITTFCIQIVRMLPCWYHHIAKLLIKLNCIINYWSRYGAKFLFSSVISIEACI